MNKVEAFDWIAERKSWWLDMAERGLHPENKRDCVAFVKYLEFRVTCLEFRRQQQAAINYLRQSLGALE
jgi:hypothetical protein